ncbi:tRNA-dihydrouridine synthase [Patescibacteria group bacterium]|nr:tRNA-dihydrouridine synthase [Patescibacteria group bacterium]
MDSFWNKLEKPFFVLAPMADVTDPAYRRLIAETGKPDVSWTEFVSADGLFHTREKKGMKDEENPLLRDLQYSEAERPIVAQFFSSTPEMMEYAASLALSLGFDGVDINMGCPDRSIEKQGAGAAHMKNPARAKEVIRAAIKGVQGKIPVSVKTRLGYNRFEYEEWLPQVLEEDIAALTVHLRTRKEMSLVPAHWELVPELVAIRDRVNPSVLLLANGDVKSISEAREKALATGLDGVMLGRGIFGNPWLFADRTDASPREKLEALLKLVQYFSLLTPPKHFAILKKHFKAFVNGFDGAAELRGKLMDTTELSELEPLLKEAIPLV